jgi:hypothetical protein
MARNRWPPFFLVLLVGAPLVATIKPVADRTALSAVHRRHRRELTLTRLRQTCVGGAHVGEECAASLGRNLLRMQNREQRQFILEGRIGVPVGRSFDAEPVNLAVRVDVGDPGDVLFVGVTILDQ